jgi:flagellar assembly protein FliH
MSTDAFKYKRPFSPDAETDELLQQWQVPDLTAEQRVNSRTNALNKTQPVAKAAPTMADEELVVKPLTAEDIEQIRQAAYDEGFAEGKDDGFSKGYAEGREQGQSDGLAQGLAEGKKQGLAAGEEELQQRLSQLSAMLDQLQQPLAAVDEQVKQQLLQLSLAMAQAVIGVEVSTNAKVILKALNEAVSALPLNAGALMIKLHPADMAVIEQHYSAGQLAQRQWQLQAEPTVAQGGCLVETAKSSVDRSLAQRLQGSLEHFLQLQQLAETNDSTDADDVAANIADSTAQKESSTDNTDAEPEHDSQ